MSQGLDAVPTLNLIPPGGSIGSQTQILEKIEEAKMQLLLNLSRLIGIIYKGVNPFSTAIAPLVHGPKGFGIPMEMGLPQLSGFTNSRTLQNYAFAHGL